MIHFIKDIFLKGIQFLDRYDNNPHFTVPYTEEQNTRMIDEIETLAFYQPNPDIGGFELKRIETSTTGKKLYYLYHPGLNQVFSVPEHLFKLLFKRSRMLLDIKKILHG
jgi:hypothetical protein